jgi:hypothetical protein
VAEPFARLQSVAARRLELVEVIVEAQRLGSPPRVRRSYPFFVVHDGRVLAARARRCALWWCRKPILRRVAKTGPLPTCCSERCAKWAYNFNPRKRETRAAWAKAKRDQRRAAGQCLGCGRSNRGAYCLTCRPRRGGARG